MDQIANIANDVRKEVCSKLTKGSDDWKKNACNGAMINEVNTFTNI